MSSEKSSSRYSRKYLWNRCQSDEGAILVGIRSEIRLRRQVGTITSSVAMSAIARQQMPHLFAGLVALSLATIIFVAAQRVLIHLEHTTIVSTAPESFGFKNQGLAFQRAAAHSPNVLMIYGTSELLRPEAPERGNIFFRTAPTGFQLSPVGSGGAGPLIMLQKIGALGSALRGKKVAISLSPGWFCTAKPGAQGYTANFSSMAATEMVFRTELGVRLQ